MFYKSDKAPPSRFLLMAMLPFLFSSTTSIAEQNSQKTDPAAENWYQVEVILFDQKTITGTELAPKQVQIGFPNNWLELLGSYPNAGIMRRPIFDSSASASIKDPKKTALEQHLSTVLGINYTQPENFNDGSTLVPEASIPYQTSNVIDIAEIDNIATFEDHDITEHEHDSKANVIDFKPVYEQQFQLLDKKYRDLNDTARGLNRRQYQIRFHEAWRFQIGSKDQSPWILVKTKKEQANRQVIEGSLRFYKSRYLHFETDLWRINFSPTKTMDIVLPETPQDTLNTEEISLLNALRFSYSLSSLSPQAASKNAAIEAASEGIYDALKGYDMEHISDLFDSAKDTIAEAPEVTAENRYPIEEIWPIKQTKRIQLDEVYYIDHPHMGALISIKSYEPVPINLPPPSEYDEDSEIEIID